MGKGISTWNRLPKAWGSPSESLRKHEDVAPEDMAHSDHAVVLVHGLKVFSNLNDSVIP